MSFPCVSCSQPVLPRQHALECESCFRWQHRLCNTGISAADYHRLVNNEVDIIFNCHECVDVQHIEDAEEATEASFGEVQYENTSTGSMEDDPEETDDELTSEHSLPDQSFDISGDIEEEEQVVESDIEEADPSDSFVVDQPVTFEVVAGGTERRANKLISSDGYSYTVKSSTARTINWRCSIRNKTVWCKATVMQKDNNFVRGPIAHVHPSDPGISKKTKVKAEVLTEATTHAYKSAADIVEEKLQQHIDDDDFNLPNPTNLTRATNRLRQKLRPAEPKDLSFEIDTQFLQCDEFIIGDLHVDAARHIMFASPEQLHILQKARRWYLDGTFKVVRNPFVQLFSIHAFLQKDDCVKQVPLVFVLMSRRKKNDYKAVFNRLKQLVPELHVQAFCMDFESAAWSAVKSVFPDTDIKGCSFHWSQAVMRQVAKLGLKPTYDQKHTTHVFIRKILALPYLPADHIRPAFIQLMQSTTTASQQLKQLMSYLSRTWFTSTIWSVRQWSVYRQSVRTNNDVEGWHRRFNGKAARSQLHFYRIVPAFQKEAKNVNITHRLVGENQLSRYQRATYRKIQGRMESLWDQYDNKTIRTSDFLRAVGNLYSPAVPNRDDLPDSDIDSDTE